MKNRSYSIIIPTYNEEKDIAETIKCLLGINWQDFEIIIVDDSSDKTVEIINSFEDDRIQIITPLNRLGRSEARNIGIKKAIGDILVILNADVHLTTDFLQKIDKHYERGFGSVSCSNSIINTHQLYARLLEARKCLRIKKGVYNKWADDQNGVVWTEGFSVRKDVAMKTSLFPSGYAVPIVAGEDAKFAMELIRARCNGRFDMEIDVAHVAPGTLREFWKVRVGRGAGLDFTLPYLLKN